MTYETETYDLRALGGTATCPQCGVDVAAIEHERESEDVVAVPRKTFRPPYERITLRPCGHTPEEIQVRAIPVTVPALGNRPASARRTVEYDPVGGAVNRALYESASAEDPWPSDDSSPPDPEHGIREVERLVKVHAAAPDGKALYEAIRPLALDESHGLLYVAIAGIAASHG